MTRSISRTLEYSYNDFCISQIANGLNNQGGKETYQQSSENWANLFKDDQTSYLFNGTNTGFVSILPNHAVEVLIDSDVGIGRLLSTQIPERNMGLPKPPLLQ